MKINLLFISIFFFFTQINAQSKLENAIKNLEENYAQEKIYLLFDKNEYVVNDNIWFKAFVFNGYKPSTISTNLFVELYDKNKNLIDKKLLPIINGQSDGSFSLKDDLQEDVYFVRAYTTYMTNFSENFQYIHQIPIYNPKSKLKLVKNDSIKWIASLHPEGGTFIENQTTKFAVRLKSDGDLPKKWKGVVIEKNQPSSKILEFDNLDENIASFYLRAELNKEYQLQISDEKSKQQIIDFPVARKEGIVLKTLNKENDIAFQIKSINLPNNLLDYSIIATQNNLVLYAVKINKNVSTISQKISNKNEGVLNISVFDEKNNLIAERLIFIHPKSISLKSNLVFDTNQTPRKINTIEIKSEISNHYTSMIRENFIENNNFESVLWLTGDFTSKISNPVQYFKENKNINALDVLLITEKWERFDWNELISGKAKKKFQPQPPYLSYKGKAYLNNQDLKNSILNLVLELPNSEKQFLTLETDSNANFELTNILSYENIKLYYYLNSKKEKSKKEDNLILSLLSTNNFSSYNSALPKTIYHLIEMNNETNNTSKIQEKNQKINKIINDKSIKLQEVVVQAEKDSKTRKMNDELSTGMFKSINEYVIDFVNDNQNAASYGNIFSFLAGRVPGFTTSIDSYGEVIPFIRNVKATVFLDEMKLAAENLNSINIDNIAMVKVYKTGMLGGSIAIYSKRGNIGMTTEKDKSTNFVNLKGYNKTASFLSNDEYETLYKNIQEDIRNVLYWNPNLISEPNTETIIEYYNNDNPKNYKLTIIGFDEKGNPVFYEGKIN